MRLAGERPWRDVTLTDIAEAADVNLVEVRRDFDSKAEILAAFVRAVDDAVLARAPNAPPQSSRDAIFDVVMSRFDVLAPYRPALKSIAATWPIDADARARSLAIAGVDAARRRHSRRRPRGPGPRHRPRRRLRLGLPHLAQATTIRALRAPWRRSTAACAAARGR